MKKKIDYYFNWFFVDGKLIIKDIILSWILKLIMYLDIINVRLSVKLNFILNGNKGNIFFLRFISYILIMIIIKWIKIYLFVFISR